mgnify:CR=1 FL=1
MDRIEKRNSVVVFNYMTNRFEDENSYFHDGFEFLSLGEHNQLSPIDYPYNFSPYWIWHSDLSDQNTWATLWSDRVLTSDGYRERYKDALEKVGPGEDVLSIVGGRIFSRAQTLVIVDTTFDGTRIATGLARACHLASGSPLLIFFSKEKPKEDSS